MGVPAVGAIVLIRFPSLICPARSCGRPSCSPIPAATMRFSAKVTSKSYGDARAIAIGATDLATGSLRVPSLARPGKLFTANQTIISSAVATLTHKALIGSHRSRGGDSSVGRGERRAASARQGSVAWRQP